MLKKDEKIIIAYVKNKYKLTIRELKDRRLGFRYFYICKAATPSYDGDYTYLDLYDTRLFNRVSDCLDFITKKENDK